MVLLTTRRAWLAAAAGLMLSTMLAPPSFADTTLSFLIDNAPNTVAWAEQLKKDFEAQNPDIKIDIEQRPGGADGSPPRNSGCGRTPTPSASCDN